jgi:hypothetical protein
VLYNRQNLVVFGQILIKFWYYVTMQLYDISLECWLPVHCIKAVCKTQCTSVAR